jgi:hypothetical protein
MVILANGSIAADRMNNAFQHGEDSRGLADSKQLAGDT